MKHLSIFLIVIFFTEGHLKSYCSAKGHFRSFKMAAYFSQGVQVLANKFSGHYL